LKAVLSPAVRLVELDAHINDEEFAVAAAEALEKGLEDREQGSGIRRTLGLSELGNLPFSRE